MGFFTDAGRAVERVKQSVTGDGDYRCGECEASLDADHEHCPECGSPAVDAVDDEA